MLSILINKDMFEPSYDALKFMIQNCSYIYTNLIHAIKLYCTVIHCTWQVPTHTLKLSSKFAYLVKSFLSWLL